MGVVDLVEWVVGIVLRRAVSVVIILDRCSRRDLVQIIVLVVAVRVSNEDLNFCLSLDTLDVFSVGVGALCMTDVCGVLCPVDSVAIVEGTLGVRSAVREWCSR